MTDTCNKASRSDRKRKNIEGPGLEESPARRKKIEIERKLTFWKDMVAVTKKNEENLSWHASSTDFKTNVKIETYLSCYGGHIQHAGGLDAGGGAEQHAGHADRQADLGEGVRCVGAACTRAVWVENTTGKTQLGK